MRMLITATSLAVASGLLAGCGGGGWWPFGSSERELSRIPDGAVVYECAENKRLVVSHEADRKSVWVHYPDRRFRLDRLPIESVERYGNGVSTLVVDGETLRLEEGSATVFANCRRRVPEAAK